MENIKNKGGVDLSVLENEEEFYNLQLEEEKDLARINNPKYTSLIDLYKEDKPEEVSMDHDRYVSEKTARANRLIDAKEKIKGMSAEGVLASADEALEEIKNARPVKLKKPGVFDYLINSIYHFFMKKDTQVVADYNDSVAALKNWEVDKLTAIAECEDRRDAYLKKAAVSTQKESRRNKMLEGLKYVQKDPNTKYLETFYEATENIRNDALKKYADNFDPKNDIPGYMARAGQPDSNDIRTFYDRIDNIDFSDEELQEISSEMVIIGTIMLGAKKGEIDPEKINAYNQMTTEQMQKYISDEAKKLRNDNSCNFDRFNQINRFGLKEMAVSFMKGKNDGNAVYASKEEKTFVNKSGEKETAEYKQYDISGMDCVKAARQFSYHLTEIKKFEEDKKKLSKAYDERMLNENSKKITEPKIENPVAGMN